MKKQYVSSMILATALLQLVSCSGQVTPGSSSSSPENVMSGVAATGAPISGGAVKIKGKNGEVVEEITNPDGSYSANIAALTEPYLVQVIAPSGEKYISVASQSALAEGKKINVTPLTHTIVANVFGKSDGDEIFANFETEAASFSEAKLETEKDELVQKFVSAGLLGASGVADANIDLLNGEFVAGSGDGVDGLLDVISVNPDASAGIEITLKGDSTPLIVDKVDGTADTLDTAGIAAKITLAKEQLSVLDKIRARMNALATLHSSKVACNGAAKDDESACDIDTLAAAFAPYFHADFQEEGDDEVAGLWGWFCRVGDDDDAKSRAECLASGTITFENVSLKDISLINYDNGNNEDPNDDIVLINFNLYLDGALKGSEDMSLKYDAAEETFDLLGNKKTFEYWIETEALHSTDYNKTSNSGTESYSVNLNFYMDDPKEYNFVGGETLTLTAVSGHQIFAGNSDTMSVYIVQGPQYINDVCTLGVTFSTTLTPYKVFNQSTGEESYANYATACPNGANPCLNECNGYYDHDVAQKVSLSATQIANMDKVERITMTGGPIAGDEFTIKKPLMINEFNASTYIPSFGLSAANFCENVSFDTSLNLSVASGTINYVNLYHGFSNADNTTWGNESQKEDYWDSSLSSAVFSPSYSTPASGDIIHYSHLYLSARDEFDRQFVRRVNCQE